MPPIPLLVPTPDSPLSRRGLWPALSGLLAASGLVAPGPALARTRKRRKRRKRRKIIARTFRSNALITINDSAPAAPYPSTIRVKGFKRGKLLDVDVTLHGLNHGDTSDIDLLLQAPNGRRALIMSDAGGAPAVTNLTVTLDDQARRPLAASGAIASGRFRPANFAQMQSIDPDATDVEFGFAGGPGTTTNVRLATFKGINPNGVWSLYLYDDAVVDSGQLARGWSLRITAKVRK